MGWLAGLVKKLEGFFQPGGARRPANRTGGRPGAPRTAILAGNLAAEGAAARKKAPPPPPPPVKADANGVLHRDTTGGADVALNADGAKIHRVGKKWFDEDGNWVAYVPILTKAQAIEIARAGGYGERDEVADAAGGGIKAVMRTLPVLGNVIAGGVDTSNGALTPADVLKNNQIFRDLAAVTVLQDQVAAGDNKSAHGAPVYDQLDPSLDDLEPWLDDASVI